MPLPPRVLRHQQHTHPCFSTTTSSSSFSCSSPPLRPSSPPPSLLSAFPASDPSHHQPPPSQSPPDTFSLPSLTVSSSCSLSDPFLGMPQKSVDSSHPSPPSCHGFPSLLLSASRILSADSAPQRQSLDKVCSARSQAGSFIHSNVHLSEPLSTISSSTSEIASSDHLASLSLLEASPLLVAAVENQHLSSPLSSSPSGVSVSSSSSPPPPPGVSVSPSRFRPVSESFVRRTSPRIGGRQRGSIPASTGHTDSSSSSSSSTLLLPPQSMTMKKKITSTPEQEEKERDLNPFLSSSDPCCCNRTGLVSSSSSFPPSPFSSFPLSADASSNSSLSASSVSRLLTLPSSFQNDSKSSPPTFLSSSSAFCPAPSSPRKVVSQKKSPFFFASSSTPPSSRRRSPAVSRGLKRSEEEDEGFEKEASLVREAIQQESAEISSYCSRVYDLGGEHPEKLTGFLYRGCTAQVVTSTAGMYGEMVESSVRQVVQYMRHYGGDEFSVFLDLGSGRGAPSCIALYQQPWLACLGIEKCTEAYSLSLNTHRTILRRETDSSCVLPSSSLSSPPYPPRVLPQDMRRRTSSSHQGASPSLREDKLTSPLFALPADKRTRRNRSEGGHDDQQESVGGREGKEGEKKMKEKKEEEKRGGGAAWDSCREEEREDISSRDHGTVFTRVPQRRICFTQEDLSSFLHLEGVTHVYSFDAAMEGPLINWIVQMFQRTKTWYVYASFRNDLISKFDLRGASIVGHVSSNMWISSEGRTTYIYVKKNWRECKAYHRRWLLHYLFKTFPSSSFSLHSSPLSSASKAKCVNARQQVEEEEAAVCRLQSTIQRAFSILLERQEQMWNSTEDEDESEVLSRGACDTSQNIPNNRTDSSKETGRRELTSSSSFSPPSPPFMASATPRTTERNSCGSSRLPTEGEGERTGRGRRNSSHRRPSQSSVSRRRSSVVNQTQRQIQIQQLYIQTLLQCCRHPGVLSPCLHLQQPLWEGEQASLEESDETVIKEVAKNEKKTSNSEDVDERWDGDEEDQLREAVRHFRSCYVRMSRWFQPLTILDMLRLSFLPSEGQEVWLAQQQTQLRGGGGVGILTRTRRSFIRGFDEQQRSREECERDSLLELLAREGDNYDDDQGRCCREDLERKLEAWRVEDYSIFPYSPVGARELPEEIRDTIEKDAVTIADSLSHLLCSSTSSVRSPSPPLSRTTSPIRRHSTSPLRKTRSYSGSVAQQERQVPVDVRLNPSGRESTSDPMRSSRRSYSPILNRAKKNSTTESVVSGLHSTTTGTSSGEDSVTTTGLPATAWATLSGEGRYTRTQNARQGDLLETLLTSTPPRNKTQGGCRAGRISSKPIADPVLSCSHSDHDESMKTTPRESNEGKQQRQTRTPSKGPEQRGTHNRNLANRSGELNTMAQETRSSRADQGNSSLKRRGSRRRQSDGVWDAHTPRMTPRTRSAFKQVEQGLEALELCSSVSRRRRRVTEAPREEELDDVKM
ncbi:hypothetical protein CSUI_000797 [Cystoisospora suis]|uniref:DOT1 domain-containing protein n=1 Tax=Cystoisospora suis TaxID=483139 RepID=A0A2C6LE37_9APIC|nr:hypothetical protein CSUI_000797 [Cystoisospora suis]